MQDHDAMADHSIWAEQFRIKKCFQIFRNKDGKIDIQKLYKSWRRRMKIAKKPQLFGKKVYGNIYKWVPTMNA